MNKPISFLQTHKNLHIPLLFFPFMYVQLVILRSANAAGRGYLAPQRQEAVYCLLQAAVIAGYLLHAALRPRGWQHKALRAVTGGALALCAGGAATLLFAPSDTAFYLAAAGVTVFLLGWLCGAVYVRLTALFEGRRHAGLGLMAGYAAAVALQFVTQLKWSILPASAALTALSFALLGFCLLLPGAREADQAPAAEQSVPTKKLARTAAVAAAFLAFTVYYTGYIHHLQVASGYGEYNVYTWPRLLLIPVVLLFGRLGDVRGGRFLPTGTLCVAAAAFLNTALAGKETYLLNMCLYYIALGAVVAYYHIVFLRLARRSARPALWAGMGRVLDSAAVLLSFGLKFSALPQAAVLGVDIGLLALAIVLMTLNGDFAPHAPVLPEAAPAQEKPDPFAVLQERFGITPAEMNVLRELVLTEDKQDVIAGRLNISVSTMRHHITSIYKKTDVQSRAGLCKLASACER